MEGRAKELQETLDWLDNERKNLESAYSKAKYELEIIQNGCSHEWGDWEMIGGIYHAPPFWKRVCKKCGEPQESWNNPEKHNRDSN